MMKSWMIVVCLLSWGMVFGAVQAKPKKEAPSGLGSVDVKDLELFNKVLYILETQYFQKVDTQELIRGAIKGMINTLDPHSAFLDKELYRKIQDDTNGEFEGIGVEITQRDGAIMIVTVQREAPAYAAGIRAGDKILRVNGKLTLGLGLVEVTQLMRGRRGEVLRLEVSRKGSVANLTFKVKREKIKMHSVISSLIEERYLYIRVSQFQRDVSQLVKKVLKKYDDKKLAGIIMDLRANPGGLLDQAVELVSLFVDKGIVVSAQDRNGKIVDSRAVVDLGVREVEVPMAVLINGASASASEIVAGALQDTQRAVIMGSLSFGKGSIQSLIPLGEKEALKLTIAQYLTPKGRVIQAKGIVPDVVLADFDAKTLKEHQKKSRFLRESDLPNHLLSESEKKGDSRSEEEVELEGDFADNNYGQNPQQDYQVQQAINILKSSQLVKSKSP